MQQLPAPAFALTQEAEPGGNWTRQRVAALDHVFVFLQFGGFCCETVHEVCLTAEPPSDRKSVFVHQQFGDGPTGAGGCVTSSEVGHMMCFEAAGDVLLRNGSKRLLCFLPDVETKMRLLEEFLLSGAEGGEESST